MDDVGCRLSDQATRLLPWTSSSTLGAWPNLSFAQPFQSREPRRCFIYVDRHVHKNGGSTMRDVLLEHERHGLGLYHGYQHHEWKTDAQALLQMAALHATGGSARHVLLVESHFGPTEFADTLLRSLHKLSRTLARTHATACPLILATRVREPLDYYLSFYRWAVGFRQRDSPRVYGTNFLEWARRVPNLQSTILSSSMASYEAEYAPKRYRSRWEPRDGAAAWRRLRALLDRFDVVAPLARFDEAMLLVHDLTGLPLLLYRRNRPKQKNGYRGTNADACPDMEACRQLVAEVPARERRMLYLT
jgi:hypothetical protein